MKIVLLALFLVKLLLINCMALEPLNAGASSNGTGNANLTQKDLFAVLNSQAVMAFLKNGGVGVFVEQRYLTSELSTFGVVSALPFKHGTFGISISRFGFNNFNETRFGLSYAKKLHKTVSFGFQVSNHRVDIIGFQARSVLYVDLGIYSELTERLSFATHVFNPTRPILGEVNQIKTASVFGIGLRYSDTNNYSLFVDLDKGFEEEFNGKIGVEYYVLSSFLMRVGINTNPSQFFGGFGIEMKSLDFDFSTSYLNNIGFTPSVSLIYGF